MAAKEAKKKKRKKRRRSKGPTFPAKFFEPIEARPADWHLRAAQIQDVYSQALTRCHDRRLGPQPVTFQSLELFHAIRRFSQIHAIDPAVWVFAVFASMSWRVPRWSSFFSVKRLRSVERLGNQEFGEVSSLAQRAESDESFAPFKDLSPGAEAAKHGYMLRGRADLCILAMDVTYGYHPASESCRSCSLRVQCSDITKKLSREYAKRAGDRRYGR